MRAISVLSLEAGTSTFGWRAWIALRTRVNMSAMGSLVIILLSIQPSAASCQPPADCCPDCWRLLSPTRLDHARNLTVERELAEAQAADSELAKIPARTSA